MKAKRKRRSPPPASGSSAEEQLAGFIAKFTPEMARRIRAARRKLRALLPHAIEGVYDNYNFLAIGYSPSLRVSEVIFSLGAYANGINLFFLQGAKVPDPHKLLLGGGKIVRMIRLESRQTLDDPKVRDLIAAALKSAKAPMNSSTKPQLLIKSISPKQRPRRP
jgi:hypothetical protein